MDVLPYVNIADTLCLFTLVAENEARSESLLVLMPPENQVRRVLWLHTDDRNDAMRQDVNWLLGEINYVNLVNLVNLGATMTVLLAPVERQDERVTTAPARTLLQRIMGLADVTIDSVLALLGDAELAMDVEAVEAIEAASWQPILLHQRLVQTAATNPLLYVDALPGGPEWRPVDLATRCYVVPNYTSGARYSPLVIRLGDTVHVVKFQGEVTFVGSMSQHDVVGDAVQVSLHTHQSQHSHAVHHVQKIVRLLARRLPMDNTALQQLLSTADSVLATPSERAELEAHRLDSVQWSRILALRCAAGDGGGGGGTRLERARLCLEEARRAVDADANDEAVATVLHRRLAQARDQL